MFKFVKQVMTQGLDRFREKQNLADERIEELELQKKYIKSLLKTRIEKMVLKVNILVLIAAAITCGVCAGLVAAVPAVLGLFSALTIGCTGIALFAIRTLSNMNNDLKTNYKDLYNRHRTDLLAKLKEIEEEIKENEEIITKMESEIDWCSEHLDMINLYEELITDPLFTSDTEEEYKEKVSSILEGNTLEDYLSEKIDYSKVHFNNKVDKKEKVYKLR